MKTPAVRFYGGKGGVGKTTCAAARALAAVDEGRAVLVVSTDPAHSLGDALGQPLSAAPRPVRGAERLDAVELDADAALGRWLDERRPSLRAIAERGTYLDDEDIDRLLRLSLPGVDELIGLLALERLVDEGRWDLVIVDTAPTGHMLRLLETPATLTRVAEIFDGMQARHRLLAERFGRGAARDEAQAVVDEMYADGRRLLARLRDPARCRFSWVLVPEPLALAETEDGLAALRARGIRVDEIVVNRLAPPGDAGCPSCGPRAFGERRALRRLEPWIGDAAVRVLAARDDEPVGVDALRAVGAELLAEPAPGWRALPGAPPQETAASGADAEPADVAPAGARLVLFGGKGGVGKSTCAAAAALAYARRHPDRRVLLLSADPAHSLGDVLAADIGDEPRPLPGAPPGLHVRELDAAAALDRERARYRDAIDRLLRGLVRADNVDIPYDRAVLRDLFELSPPGVDELFAVLAVLDALPVYDRVYVDTAPTGHALRLLELPALALQWVHALMAILLKYRDAVGLGDLAEALLALARQLRRLRALLVDPERAAFVVVTGRRALVRRESERLVAALERLGIAVSAVIVNRAAPRSGCRRCRARAEEDERAAREIAGRTGVMIMAPGRSPPPTGADELAAWSRTWRVHRPGAGEDEDP